MKIGKAMKKISRLKGEIADLRNRMAACNSYLKDNSPTEDFRALKEERAKKKALLMFMKNAVMEINIQHNKFIKVLELGELKEELEFWKTLDCREGKTINYDGAVAAEYVSQVAGKEKIAKVEELKKAVEDATDELDEFNAAYGFDI